MIALWLACGGRVVEGHLVDGPTGAPIASGTVWVAAEDGCAAVETPVRDGTFRLDGVRCEGPWRVTGRDGQLVVPPRSASGGSTFASWPAPRGGVWVAGAALTEVPATSRVVEEVLLGGAGVVRGPDVLPDEARRITPAEWLLLEGDHADAQLHVLVESGPRRFGDPAAPREVGAWSWLDVRFDDDAIVHAVTVEPAEQHVVRDARGLRAWIGGEALPAGTYALESGRRLYVIRFDGAATGAP